MKDKGNASHPVSQGQHTADSTALQQTMHLVIPGGRLETDQKYLKYRKIIQKYLFAL